MIASSLSVVCFVYLVYLVHLVSFVQRLNQTNQTDQMNQTDESNRGDPMKHVFLTILCVCTTLALPAFAQDKQSQPKQELT
jgi:hypothetical protein